MIKTINIDTIDQLIQELNQLSNKFIYRGHACSSWLLESTLERVIGSQWNKDKAITFEDRSLSTFRSKYQIYNQTRHTPTSKLSWLAMMQHYGVPTRLLDFTESPYIALYFALEAYVPSSKVDFSIHAINYSDIMDTSIQIIKQKKTDFTHTRFTLHEEQDKVFDDIVDQSSYDILWITEPLELNNRIDRQAGTFLISGNREKTIESIISTNLYPDCIVKFVIAHHLYKQVYALLRKMNINAKSIYGDLEGLAKSIRMELQVYGSC